MYKEVSWFLMIFQNLLCEEILSCRLQFIRKEVKYPLIYKIWRLVFGDLKNPCSFKARVLVGNFCFIQLMYEVYLKNFILYITAKLICHYGTQWNIGQVQHFVSFFLVLIWICFVHKDEVWSYFFSTFLCVNYLLIFE